MTTTELTRHGCTYHRTGIVLTIGRLVFGLYACCSAAVLVVRPR